MAFLLDIFLRFIRVAIELAPWQFRSDSGNASCLVNCNAAFEPWLRLDQGTRSQCEESIDSIWLAEPDVGLDVNLTPATVRAKVKLPLDFGGGR